MKLEVLKTIKTSDRKIWRAGLVLSEAQGDELPPELIKEFDRGTGLIQMYPEPDKPKKESPVSDGPVDRITFRTKSDVKSAKKPDLMAYLADAGVVFSAEETRDKLVEKALEVLEVNQEAGENDAI